MLVTLEMGLGPPIAMSRVDLEQLTDVILRTPVQPPYHSVGSRKSAGRRVACVLSSHMRLVFLTAFLLPSVLRAQAVRVTGVAFDSLGQSPLATAFVTLGSRSTMADTAGRFAFDSVAPGPYRVTL